MRDELSLEQKLEAMLTVALEPISAEELADVLETDAAEVDDGAASAPQRVPRRATRIPARGVGERLGDAVLAGRGLLGRQVRQS